VCGVIVLIVLIVTVVFIELGRRTCDGIRVSAEPQPWRDCVWC